MGITGAVIGQLGLLVCPPSLETLVDIFECDDNILDVKEMLSNSTHLPKQWPP